MRLGGRTSAGFLCVQVFAGVPFFVCLLESIYMCWDHSFCSIFSPLCVCMCFPPLQMVPTVVFPSSVSHTQSSFQSFLDAAFTFLRFQPPGYGTGAGLCVLPRMSLPLRLSFGYLVPGGVGVAMLLGFAVGTQVSRWPCCIRLTDAWRRQRGFAPHAQGLVTRYHSVKYLGSSRSLPVRATADGGEDGIELQRSVPGGASNTPSATANPLWALASSAHKPGVEIEGALAGSDPSAPLRARGLAALLTWALFTYSSVLSTTLLLLSCVSVPGAPSTYLFLDANRDCSSAGWVGPLTAVCVCVLALAAFVPYAALLLHRRRVAYPALYWVLCGPFTDGAYWWESVLLAQRTALLSLSAGLVQYPVPRLLAAGCVCMLCFAVHLTYKPLQHHAMQHLQTLFQGCLLVTVMANVAVAQTAEVPLGAQSPAAADAVNALQLLCVYVLPVGAVAVLAARPALASLRGVVTTGAPKL